MRALRYAVALVVVVDFLVAVVQMQQAIIERASFRPPSVTTFGQYAVTLRRGRRTTSTCSCATRRATSRGTGRCKRDRVTRAATSPATTSCRPTS